MKFIIMHGDYYKNILRDDFHALGIHECQECFIDIDEDEEHGFRAYPHENGRYICERCKNYGEGDFMKRLTQRNNNRGWSLKPDADMRTVTNRLAEYEQMEDERRILPDGFACTLLSNGTVAVCAPRNKCMVIHEHWDGGVEANAD